MTLSQGFLAKLNDLNSKYKALFDWVIKPIAVSIFALLFWSYTLWLDSHYVANGQFQKYVTSQEEVIKSQKLVVETQNNNINSKLENILQNQTQFTEQMKTLNLIWGNQQKQIQSVEDRVLYIERNKKDKNLN